MKKILLPASMTAPGGTMSGRDVIRSMVLVLPFWKNASDLKYVEAVLHIEDALDKSPHEPKISDDAHGLLVTAMGLQNGAAQVNDPVANRMYMKVFRAVLRAETVDEQVT